MAESSPNNPNQNVTAGDVQNAVDNALAAAVSVKLPPFWPEKARLWFVQAEAHFTIKRITTEETKFAYVVTMLDSSTADQDRPYQASSSSVYGSKGALDQDVCYHGQ